MEQIKFETALEAAHRDGYEQGFHDRGHTCDRNAGGSWARWFEADGEQIVRVVADDEPILQVLLGEILHADLAGTDRCQAKSASGELRSCIRGDVIRNRALALMSLQKALEDIHPAPNRPDFDSCSIEFEKQLMDGFPAYVDVPELVEWNVYTEEVKSKRLEELA